MAEAGRRRGIQPRALASAVGFVAVVAIAVGLMASGRVGQAIVAASLPLLIVGGCFGAQWTRDRAMFLSVLLPTLAAALMFVLVLVAVDHWSPVLLGLGLAWPVAWLVAWDRIRPWWARVVLRRPPDPEGGFSAAWRDVRERWRRDPQDRRALFQHVAELRAAGSERTAVLYGVWLAFLDLGRRPDDAERANRVFDRGRELMLLMRSGPLVPDQPWPNPHRPTEGTLLELVFPELEALVAAATPAEQRAIAMAAARSACERVGLDPGAVAAALDTADSPADVADALGGGDDADEMAVAERRLATRSMGYAIAEPLDPIDVADAVWEAARTRDEDELARLAAELRTLVDPERLSTTAMVTVDAAAIAAHGATVDVPPPDDVPVLPPGLPLTAVASVGFVAGAGGTIVGAVVSQLWPDLPGLADYAINGGVTVALAWLLLAGFGVRLPARRLPDLGVLWTLTYVLVVVVLAPLQAQILSRVAPDVWQSVFVERETLMPYAPLDGLATATVFVAAALYLRRTSTS